LKNMGDWRKGGATHLNAHSALSTASSARGAVEAEGINWLSKESAKKF